MIKSSIIILLLSLSSLFAIDVDSYINQNNCDQIISKKSIDICYDYNLKVAKAVSYTLFGELVNENNIEKRLSFRVERELDREYRASTTDYTKSGYDRGHLACDAAFDWSQDVLQDTYSLANIIPQARKVNRYTWTKAERYARFIATSLGDVQVINVVKYSQNPKRIGKNGIAVPIGFYKVLYNKNQDYQKCLYYENSNDIDTSNDRLKEHEVECSTVSFLDKPIRRTCSSFKNRNEAQNYYDNKQYGWARLDGDKDEEACESLAWE